MIAGMSLTEFGLIIPSPFASLALENSEITSMTSWTLTCVIGGDANRKANVSAFEGLLYSAAQAASRYPNSSGIPVSFMFGWLNDDGSVGENISYQGFTIKFDVSTSGLYLVYKLTGYASIAMQSSMPVLRIPELSGMVQPSAVVEALAKAVKADRYYTLDIDHNDSPTLVSHGAITTSFNQYVRGDLSVQDDFDAFPGLLKLSKSYNMTRDAAGLKYPHRKLSSVLNNIRTSAISSFLKQSMTDATPQCSSFSYWIDEPTMTRPGVIHYKSNSSLSNYNFSDSLEYGTSNSNILSLSGSYNGVAYNMTDMAFSSVGFALDGSGNSIVQGAEVVNSWSSSLADVYKTVDIINDVNALASQFSGNFSVQIAGSVKEYEIAQPVSLVVFSGNTLSPITGIYNIISVSHSVGATFVTTLKLQRLVMSSANQVASSQGILLYGSGSNVTKAYTTTNNIISPYKVDFGDLYPDFTRLVSGFGGFAGER